MIAQEIERTVERYPEVALQARRIMVEGFRLIAAMQRGDRAGVERAIAARSALLPKLNNVELSWHHSRMLVIRRMNEGEFSAAEAELAVLQAQAERLQLHAHRLLWHLDHGVLLTRTGDVSAVSARARSSLKLSASDPPLLMGRKIRSMVDFGLTEDIASALSQLPVAVLEDLPHDREYLPTLCHLASGAAAIKSETHCEAVYRLLSPYGAYYCVGISYHCDGSVAAHLGLLREAVGDDERARAYYNRGIKLEEAFGLLPAAARTSLRLAEVLLRAPNDKGKALAMPLLTHVASEAERMGMQPLARAARARIEGL